MVIDTVIDTVVDTVVDIVNYIVKDMNLPSVRGALVNLMELELNTCKKGIILARLL